MAKQRSFYQCTQCGYECAKWMGKCPNCGSFLEIKGRKNPKIVCSNEKCGFVKEMPQEEEE